MKESMMYSEDRSLPATRLGAGTGTIEVHDEQREQFAEVIRRIASFEFHGETGKTVPAKCIDGRSALEGFEAPNTAGGSLSLVVADDLVGKHFAAEQFSDSVANVMGYLHDQRLAIGAHTDTHAHGDASGCGANDRLPEVYRKIQTDGDTVRSLVESIVGEPIDEDLHRSFVTSASLRQDFGTGRQNLDEMCQAGGSVETLAGDHHEIAAVINLREGTTLDRAALQQSFGDAYQSFNVDVWSFKYAAEVLSSDATEQQQLIIALAYYNIATALVLCGPDMQVVTLA